MATSQAARYLESSQVRAIRPAGAVHPRLEVIGEFTVLSAQIKRVFPLSNPAEYLCIQNGKGEEIGILRQMKGLENDTYRIFEEELDRRYFTPTIEQVYDLNQEAGMWHFAVQTQRGETDFYVRNWRDSAHEISRGRWQIYSVDGGRFDIPNLEALDARSKKFMARLL